MKASLKTDHEELDNQLNALMANVILSTGLLAIGTVSAAKVKVTNSITALINGKVVSIAAAEVALAGTITDGNINVFAIVANAAGTLSAKMGTEGATIAAVILPDILGTEVVLGFITVATAAADFVGGTTELSAATATDLYFDTPLAVSAQFNCERVT